MRLRLNPLAQNGLSVVEPTIVNSTTSSSTTGGGTVPTSVDDLSPSQTGNAGKFLKTDGTNATWEAIPGGGDMLTTNNLSDLTDAAIARTNLGVDAAGTDNSTDVTLAGTGTYISLTGQQITVDPITESDITDLNHAVDVVSNVATSTILGRVTAGSGNSEELTAAQVRTLINVADGATANSSDATLLARANHTGTQSADTITDGTTNKAYTATEKTKLAGIATGATANTGDVVGPASAVDNELVTFDSITGKLIQGGTTITAAPVVGGGEIKSSGELYLSSIDGTYVNGTNMATVISDSASAVQPGDLATVATTGSYSDLSSTPTLGTAAAKNIPATGDASATEVVYGTDTRLTNARTPTAHTHTASEVTDFDTAVAANSAVAANTAKVGVTTQISNVVEDTTPQLGGNLDANGNAISVPNNTVTIGTTTDVFGEAINVQRNSIKTGRIDNNGGGMRVQAVTGTLYLRGSGNSGMTVDASGNVAVDGTVDGRDIATDGSKLDGIATGATANSSDATLLNTDNHTSGTTNKVYTATEQSKLSGIEIGATADQTGSEILALVGPLLYPVGSYYINETDSTNPGTLLGFGTWTAVTDKFIVGHGTTYTTTGGSSTHTHTLSSSGTADIAIGTNVIYEKRVSNGGGGNWTATHKLSATATTDTTAVSVGASLEGSTDSGSSDPPYQAAYIWKRTA